MSKWPFPKDDGGRADEYLRGFGDGMAAATDHSRPRIDVAIILIGIVAADPRQSEAVRTLARQWLSYATKPAVDFGPIGD